MMKMKMVLRVSVGIFALILICPATAQVATRGLSPAANTLGTFVDASVIRDSRVNQPLDLLNDFYPAIEVTITDHDNVRRRSDIKEQDLKLVVKPSLAYSTNLGRHKFYAAYSGTFVYHDDFGQEDTNSNALAAQLGLDVSRRWDLNVFADIGEAYEERGISGSRPFNEFIPGTDRGPDEIDYQHYGADLIYGRKVSRLNAVLGFEKSRTSFTNNFQGDENITGGRDRETDSVHFDLSYKIGDKTSIFGRIQRSDIDYDRSLNSLDSEQTDYLFGVRWKPTYSLSGVAGIGSSDKDFDDPSRADYDDVNYYVNLAYLINPFSSVYLNASKVIEEPGDDLSDYYDSQLLGIGWDHEITPRVSFNAFAKWIDDDYSTSRKDDFFDFGLGLDYAWRPWLTAGVYYGEIERDSTDSSIDYEDRYIGIRLYSDLRTLLRGRGSRTEPESSFRYPEAGNR